MLTEQRYEVILRLLAEKKSVTVAEIRERLNTSESTVRRDITALHQAGKLTKVFGGAVALEHTYVAQEPTVAQKAELYQEEKQRIARAAASLIGKNEFVYLDAGTTTGCMLDYLAEPAAVYVTNAVVHAQRLAARGFRVILIGGELKSSTEAVIGSQAMDMLKNYHFSKGFFGANGISRTAGFTTPDANEALIKKTAMQQCMECYVLADHSKAGRVSSVTFAPFGTAKVLTDCVTEGYEEETSFLVCR